jgi:hypothetical protein
VIGGATPLPLHPDEEFEIGWQVDPREWGHGYATESGLAPPAARLASRPADLVAFGDNDHPDAQFTVPWQDAFRLAGDALQEEAGYDPPCWRHRGWPDNGTLASLRVNAVPLPRPADPAC